MLAFQVADIYQIQAFRGHEKQYMRLASAWSVVFLIAIGVSFFAKAGDQFSRAWLGGFYVLGLFALIAFRRGLFLLVRRWTQEGRLDRRTVVVGCDSKGETLIRSLGAQRDSDVRLIGVFDDRGDERSPASAAGVPKLGTVDDLVEFARHSRVDLVIFSLPISAEDRILQMLKKLWVLPVDIRLSAHTNKLRYRPRSYSYVGNVPVLDVFDKPIADWDVVMKWLFDKIVGTLALIVALPVMLAVAIAVKLDSRGPILFKQKRFGFNNEPIEIYKFRSMYADQTDQHAEKQVTRGDPRVTRVGRFIRKTSLDELPQLFNVVFAGNLSLVGPRPHALQAKAENRLYDEAVDGYFARHRVKPGLTGWAQIHGWRGETDSQEKIQRRVEHDLYYIENWSILLDLYILAADAVRTHPHGECVLSRVDSAAAIAGGEFYAAAPALPQRLLNIVLFVTVLSSSIAFIEPSPHDLLMVVLFAICVAARVPFDRKIAPLVLLLTLWLVGAFFALIPVVDQRQAVQYVATSVYLALAAIIFACLYCDGNLVRLLILRRAYIIAALIATAAGYIGFFHLLPGSDIFLANDRVSATFKDPNVYAPFLIFPLLLLLVGMMTERVRLSGAGRRDGPARRSLLELLARCLGRILQFPPRSPSCSSLSPRPIRACAGASCCSPSARSSPWRCFSSRCCRSAPSTICSSSARRRSSPTTSDPADGSGSKRSRSASFSIIRTAWVRSSSTASTEPSSTTSTCRAFWSMAGSGARLI